MNWGVEDYIAAAVMLGGAGVAYWLLARRTRDAAYRAGAAMAIVAALVLVWGNLAVGLIGSEDNPANLMYAAVLGVGVAGACWTRFRPRGMARALFAAAVVQVLIGAIALLARLGPPLEMVLLNGFFAALFIGSGWLFRRAAER